MRDLNTLLYRAERTIREGKSKNSKVRAMTNEKRSLRI